MSLGFIDINLGEDVKERVCAPEGEYDLIADDVERKEYEAKKDGFTCTGHYLNIRHTIEGDTENKYKPVYHNLFYPTEFDDKDKRHNKALAIKRYLIQAGIPMEDNGFEESDIPGAQFRAYLTVSVDPDGKYEDSNEIKLDKLRD